MLKPLYGEFIIVGVLSNLIWEWYVTEKELWFLDYHKLEKAYLNRGYKTHDLGVEDKRKGIKVVDEQTVLVFLQRIKDYVVNKNELNSLMEFRKCNNSQDDDLLDFSPSLLIDFDNKRLYSMFPEPASFEEYVPSGWIGQYLDFTKLVPDEEKYWVDKLGNNMFESSDEVNE